MKNRRPEEQKYAEAGTEQCFTEGDGNALVPILPFTVARKGKYFVQSTGIEKAALDRIVHCKPAGSIEGSCSWERARKNVKVRIEKDGALG